MLVIRNAQMTALGKATEAAFRERAFEHLARIIPEVCGAMTHEHILESIDYAILRCRSLGAERELDVLRYLNLMYVFGFEFEQLPWVQRILAEKSMRPEARMEWLKDHAIYVAGKEAESVH